MEKSYVCNEMCLAHGCISKVGVDSRPAYLITLLPHKVGKWLKRSIIDL